MSELAKSLPAYRLDTALATASSAALAGIGDIPEGHFWTMSFQTIAAMF